MAGMYGVSAYQQTNRSWETNHTGVNRTASSSSGTDQANQTKESSAAKVVPLKWKQKAGLQSTQAVPLYPEKQNMVIRSVMCSYQKRLQIILIS